jgi:spermidine synthase
MRPLHIIEETTTPDGSVLRLLERDGDWEVSLDGVTLMGSREHYSEEEMAAVACSDLADAPGARVLVGGLGLGFTLRAALDRLRVDATVVVVELLEAVVAWNRQHLAGLAGRPLEDPRVQCVRADLVDWLAAAPEPFDAIVLDLDNGPEAFTVEANARLYSRFGLQRVVRAMRPGAVVVVWSAFASPAFAEALAAAGLDVEVVTSRSRGRRGRRHTLFFGRRPR